MKKGFKYLFGMIAATLTIGSSALAAEYSVTPVQATWYTNDQTVICEDADVNTIVVPSCEKYIPVNIIGVTSNGFWQVQLDKIYYIPSAGLSETMNTDVNNTTPVTDTTTTVTRNANGTVPVKDANGNYVCLIEGNDNEQFYSCTGIKVFDRQDLTTDSMYIYFRDEIEQQIATGKDSVTVKWRGSWISSGPVSRNLILDIYKSHPEYCDNSYGGYDYDFDFAANQPTGLETVPIPVETVCTHYINVQKSDKTSGQISSEADALFERLRNSMP